MTFDVRVVLEGKDITLTWDTPEPTKVYTVEVSKDLFLWEQLGDLSGVGFNSALLRNATLTPICCRMCYT